MRLFQVSLVVICLFVGGCATRPLPKFQKPLKRAQVQRVRTTAYTHSEADHVAYGRRTALGTRLRSEGIKSAAADWSRWPAGTLFRVRETGELYEVDDYGWALSGTNTIDLYKPSRSAMNSWGVRRVTIENLRWGNPYRSLAILKARKKHRHLKRMVDEYRRYGMRFPVLVQLEPPQPAAPPPLALETRRAIAVEGGAPVLTSFH
ncbi:MAG: hypothetical protein V4710_14230 [Verrucomicrobiota bacterium]